jgi:hypothetical protein
MMMLMMAMAQAVSGSDITGCVSGTLHKFLKEPELPIYYQMKAYWALSGADEEDEPWENLAACRHYLKKATEALKESQRTYISKEDTEFLEVYEKELRAEWVQFYQRERLMDSDDEDGDGEEVQRIFWERARKMMGDMETPVEERLPITTV